MASNFNYQNIDVKAWGMAQFRQGLGCSDSELTSIKVEFEKQLSQRGLYGESMQKQKNKSVLLDIINNILDMTNFHNVFHEKPVQWLQYALTGYGKRLLNNRKRQAGTEDESKLGYLLTVCHF